MHLFQPFSLGKWVLFALPVFLMTVGQSVVRTALIPVNVFSNASSVPAPGTPARAELAADIERGIAWVAANASLVLGVALAAAVALVAASLLFGWLAARGEFMFVNALAEDRLAPGEAWKRSRAPGNRLFVFRLLLAAASGLVALLGVALGAAIAWQDYERGLPGTAMTVGILVAVGVLVPAVFGASVLGAVVDEFAVPRMVLHGEGVGVALKRVWRELIRPHYGAVIVYWLLRFLVSLAFGIAASVLGSCCCLFVGVLPYVSGVVLLPMFVFMRAWSLCFVGQLSPEWRVLPEPAPAAPHAPWQR
jgi:hypothetical protein